MSSSAPIDSSTPLPLSPISSMNSTENLLEISPNPNSTIWYDPNKYTLELEEEFRHSITTDTNNLSSSNI